MHTEGCFAFQVCISSDETIVPYELYIAVWCVALSFFAMYVLSDKNFNYSQKHRLTTFVESYINFSNYKHIYVRLRQYSHLIWGQDD